MKKIIITIDGPAASGKGRIAKHISKKWNLQHVDSGLLYRQVAFSLKKSDVNLNSIPEIKKNILSIKKLSFRKNKKLRTQEISKITSKIAVYKFVRSFINKFQTEFVSKNIKTKGFVIDGRDIGSVVFKNADLKLFIEVNEINRAKATVKSTSFE